MDTDSETESLLDSSYNELNSSSSDSESEDDSLDVARNWCRLDSAVMSPAPPSFPFTGCPGIKVPIRDDEDPFDYFDIFFDDELFSFIIQETNRYASEYFETTDLTPSSRSLKWTDTCKNEMRRFIALLLLQGMVQKPVELWFWSKRPILSTPMFGNIMTQNRYGLIMKFLHFEDNSTFDSAKHPQPKLRKIYNVQKRLVEKFQNVYIPDREISIDESLMAYRGLLGWKQYIPNKKAKFGIKFYQLCEAKSGYIWNSLIYTGKGTRYSEKYEEYGSSTKSVMTLIDDLLGQGYCLTTDNFYSSPELDELLIAGKTDLYGTLRANRKNLPVELRTQRLKKGDVIAFQKGKICALKWKDKKDVCMLSTVHSASMVSVSSKKTKTTKMKPSVVADYNNSMGGVDKSDQCLAYYPVMRNQQRKYYKKRFRHLLNQSVWNSFVLYKKKCGSLKHMDFRMRLIERLIEESGPREAVPHRGFPSKIAENVVRLTGRHFPSHIPDNALLKRKSPSRKCVVCGLKSNVNGKRVRRETRYECQECNVGLCVAPCFKTYHTVLEL